MSTVPYEKWHEMTKLFYSGLVATPRMRDSPCDAFGEVHGANGIVSRAWHARQRLQLSVWHAKLTGMLKPSDPHITVSDALALYGDVQVDLARALDLTRASVNQWVTEMRSGKRVYLPAAAAGRLLALHPHLARRRKAKAA